MYPMICFWLILPQERGWMIGSWCTKKEGESEGRAYWFKEISKVPPAPSIQPQSPSLITFRLLFPVVFYMNTLFPLVDRRDLCKPVTADFGDGGRKRGKQKREGGKGGGLPFSWHSKHRQHNTMIKHPPLFSCSGVNKGNEDRPTELISWERVYGYR